MLHFIRERAQGWVAWFIVGLISIPFALWGVNSYVNGPSDPVTATVNGESIKQAEYQRAFQQYRERMREAMGESFDPELLEGQAVKQSVLDGLIEQKLLQQANAELAQRVSDSAINQMIKATPAFQTQGQFDPERYRMMLARIGESPASYEPKLRLDVLAQELTNNIQQSTLVSQHSIENLLRIEKQERDIAYGVVSAQSMLEQVEISEQQVEDFYEQNKTRYLAPERVSIDYIELSLDELAKSIQVEDAALQQFYVDNQSQFVGPEQRKASHILIEGEEEEALKTIAIIQQRLEEGEDFALLATEYSADSGSAADGGDLGLFQRDVMDPAFEQAVFSMTTVGDVSDAIETEFGFHLIKLTEIKTPEGKSFSAAFDEIDKLYRLQQAEELFYEQAEQLADLSYENPDSLDATAEALALPIQQTEAFTRDGGMGIASDKKVVNVSFSEDVLVNDLNSAVIEVSKTKLVVLHKREHILASQLPYESIAPAIKEQLRFEQARDEAKQQGEEILAKLKAGEAIDSLFSEGDWYQTQSYSRASSEVSAQVLQHAFKLPKPSPSAVEVSGFSASNGNYIVLQLSAVKDGAMDNVTAEDRDGLQSYLARINGSSELQAFIDSLREGADIEVMSHNLK